jgi:2Fe-2S ferredoxin
MVKITYIDSFGEARTIEAQEGATVMENAIRNAIPEITAECGGGCACATCHVYVGEKWVGLTGKASDQEEDMLDFAYKVTHPRLFCQDRGPPKSRASRHHPGPAGLGRIFGEGYRASPMPLSRRQRSAAPRKRRHASASFSMNSRSKE